jgi:hypothetical protein
VDGLKMKNIMFVIAALGIGAAAGWFAAGLTGTTGVSPVRDGEGAVATQQAREGRAPARPDQNAKSAPRTMRKAPIRSANDAGVQKRILERRIHDLEQGIRIAKAKRARMVDRVKSASNAELVERLLKLPTEWEREKALEQLGEERMKSLTLAELSRILPKAFEVPDEAVAGCKRTVEKTGFRLGILDSVDPSGMSEEERNHHAAFVDNYASMPGLFVKMLNLDAYDRVTWGEQLEDIQRLIAASKRRDELLPRERQMLLSQAAKSFKVPDESAAGLMSALDEVSKMTDYAWGQAYHGSKEE